MKTAQRSSRSAAEKAAAKRAGPAPQTTQAAKKKPPSLDLAGSEVGLGPHAREVVLADDHQGGTRGDVEGTLPGLASTVRRSMYGFMWILEGWLATSARPGLLRSAKRDMAYLGQVGIRLIVSLTAASTDPPASDFGFEGIHFPMERFAYPDPNAMLPLCLSVMQSVGHRQPVLLHCHEGFERVGGAAGCCLVALGFSATNAIRFLRSKDAAFLSTGTEEEYIFAYEECLLTANSSPSSVRFAHRIAGSS